MRHGAPTVHSIEFVYALRIWGASISSTAILTPLRDDGVSQAGRARTRTLTPRLPGAPRPRVPPANPDVSTPTSKHLCHTRPRVMAQV